MAEKAGFDTGTLSELESTVRGGSERWLYDPIAGLFRPDLLIEVEAVAATPG